MINGATELVLVPATSNPGDDISTVGGGPGSTPVTGAAPGEIFPQLQGNQTGTIDVDVQRQTQKAFWQNTNSASDLLKARIWLKNGLIRPVVAGTIFIVLNHAADAGKQLRFWDVNSAGVLVPESINTPTGVGASNATNGVANVAWVERVKLVDATSGVLVTAVGDIEIRCGSNVTTAEVLGVIPGATPRGAWSWATSEVGLLGIGSLDDTSTIANRRATSLTGFTRANSYAAGIVIRLDPLNDTLTHGAAQGFWVRQTLQPGIPSADDVQYAWRIEGSTTA